MAGERNLSTQDVTGNLLSRRLNLEQKLVILKSSEFQQYLDRLREDLLLTLNLPPNDFKLVHSLADCEVVEIFTGNRTRTVSYDIDFGTV